MKVLRLLCKVCVCLIIIVPCQGQKSYDLRFRVSTLDTATRSVCYHLEMRNSGQEEWILSNYNIAIFYDTSAACFVDHNLLLDNGIYDPNVTNIETSAVGTPLPYESSLGFIRAGLAANGPGVVLDTSGTWVPTIEFCFTIKFDNITDPGSCFQVNFNSPELQPFIGVPPNIVQEWNPGVFISDILADQIFDNLPAPTLSSCFVIEENTTDLCSDGIDNDEDGLADCEDTDGCSVGQPSINVTNPSCQDTLGRFRVNIPGGNVEYSLDGGITRSSDSIFDNLPAGMYQVWVIRNGIDLCPFVSPVTLLEPDCVEDNDFLCIDGQDNDIDGTIDCADLDCTPMIDGVMITPSQNCPDLNDGMVQILSIDNNVEYSIDGGINYSDTSVFSNLVPGSYDLFIRNRSTMCFSPYISNPVIVMAALECPDPVENCNDGLDNDDDGLIDCQDADCNSSPFCLIETDYYIPTAFIPQGVVNNQFGVFTPPDQPLTITSFHIFDRWGNQVHAISNMLSVDNNHRWDGKIQNVWAPVGVYVYIFKVSIDGKEKEIPGDVTVIN